MLKANHEKVETETQVGIGWAHALFCEAYHNLGAEPAPFDREEGLGSHFLGCLQDELTNLPTIITRLMAYASLSTYEGAVNVMSHEGYNRFIAFEHRLRSNSNFKCEVF